MWFPEKQCKSHKNEEVYVIKNSQCQSQMYIILDQSKGDAAIGVPDELFFYSMIGYLQPE